MRDQLLSRFTRATIWGAAMVAFLVAFSTHVGDSTSLIIALAAGALFSIPLRRFIENMNALNDPHPHRVTCPACGEPPGEATFSTAPDQLVCTGDCPVNTWDPSKQ